MLTTNDIMDDNFDPRWMLKVENAWKTYDGKNYVLNNLHMNINKGQIYSLLGSSGVGKSTLLQSIVGINNLNYGKIKVDVKSRLEIGYMPQDLALYTELSVTETFIFFGMILHMTRNEIIKRLKKLTDLLELPNSNRQINSMSGGEQRRISIAVSMLNNPTFLILDEPTASLDSVLKQSIWTYLRLLTRAENKTILLTTHYIEEANNSDKVGFISSGKILLEGTPAEVKLCCRPPLKRLEDVYFYLCKENQSTTTTEDIQKLEGSAVNSLCNFNNYSSKRVIASILKTIFYIRRNCLIFYVFIICPALMALILTAAYDRPRGMTLGYINLESNCTNLLPNCSLPLSCRYLEKLSEREFKMIEIDSVEKGKIAIEKNHIWGLVKLSWNFSDGVVNRLDYFYSDKPVEVAEDDEAKVWLDMSSYPISYIIKKHFYDSFLKSIEEWYDDCGWNRKAAHPTIKFEDPIFGKIEESIKSLGIPTVIVILAFATSSFLGLMFVLTETELGTLNRCKVNGFQTYELLTAVFLSCFVCLIPTGIALLLIPYIFTSSSNGPIFWNTFIFFMQIANGILFGSLSALHFKTVANALQVINSFSYSFTFVSGIIWPSQAIHWIGKIFVYTTPPIIPSISFATLANRGFGKEAYYGSIYSLMWTIILIILIKLSLKIKQQ